MKKLLFGLLVLSAFAWGLALADPTARLLIDIQSAVITTPDGTDLKIGTGYSATVNGTVHVLSDGAAEMTITPTAVTIPTNNLAVTAGSVTGGTGLTATAGGVTITAGDITLTNGVLKIPDAKTLGVAVQSAGNQACNTTCTTGCIGGLNTIGPALVDCSDAAADSCFCATAP